MSRRARIWHIARESKSALAYAGPEDDDEDGSEKLRLSLCPFCGGAARFGRCVPGEQEGENDGAEYVECCDCGASTCLVFPLMDSAKQVLRDMWNRRTDARDEPPNG